MGCTHNAAYECFTCADNRHTNEHPSPVAGCATCKLQSIQVSQAVRPARPGGPPPAGNRNAWEAGRVTDHRGVPYLWGDDHHPMTTKELANNRSRVDARIRELHNNPNAFTDA